MQSDPWWSFAMAVNVYMVFFMSFNPTTFRQYLWIYCVICFGLPAVPAFIFLFLREKRGLVYGDAAVSRPLSSSQKIGLPSYTVTNDLMTDKLLIAMVLDQLRLECASHLLLLLTHLGVLGPVCRHILCYRLPCVPPAEPVAQPVTEQSGTG